MKTRYYKLWLKPLVDAEGVGLSYYHFDNKDDEDLEWPWGHGILLKDPPTQPLQMKIDFDDEDAAEFADYLINPFMMVTERFRKALNAAGVSNLEYYPVTIEGAEEFDAFPTYFAVNIVGAAMVADMNASVYTEAFGGPGATTFEKFVVKPNFRTDLQIFRMAEKLATVIVSERVKESAEKLGVETLDFIPLEDS